MRLNNKLFPSLNVISGKSSPNGSKVILRHYYYRSDTKLGTGIFPNRRITCSCHACKTILSLTWYSKIKEEYINTRYGRVYISSTIKLLVIKITGLQ